jgi:hypothetical protein
LRYDVSDKRYEVAKRKFKRGKSSSILVDAEKTRELTPPKISSRRNKPRERAQPAEMWRRETRLAKTNLTPINPALNPVNPLTVSKFAIKALRAYTVTK